MELANLAQAEKLLTDPEKTEFFFVTLPEALPIAVIRRFISWFTDFGIPVGGVVVNQLIDKKEVDTVPDFVRNRVAMQEEYMCEIRTEFDGMVRAVLPLYDSEIRGVESLRRAGEALFARSGADLADWLSAPTGPRILFPAPLGG